MAMSAPCGASMPLMYGPASTASAACDPTVTARLSQRAKDGETSTAERARQFCRRRRGVGFSLALQHRLLPPAGNGRLRADRLLRIAGDARIAVGSRAEPDDITRNRPRGDRP